MLTDMTDIYAKNCFYTSDGLSVTGEPVPRLKSQLNFIPDFISFDFRKARAETRRDRARGLRKPCMCDRLPVDHLDFETVDCFISKTGVF